jgi:hypothetical protein
VIKGSPKFLIKRIGYCQYLATEAPVTFSHVPAGALYFDSEIEAEAAMERAWPTVSARIAAQCFIARVA